MKCSQVNTVRRTSSLHINNHRNLSNSLLVKTSNSHHEQLTDSNLDLSRINPQRRSIRNLEKFSGIKCSLPSSTSTLPNTSKNLDKHCTPIHSKSTTNVSLVWVFFFDEKKWISMWFRTFQLHQNRNRKVLGDYVLKNL